MRINCQNISPLDFVKIFVRRFLSNSIKVKSCCVLEKEKSREIDSVASLKNNRAKKWILLSKIPPVGLYGCLSRSILPYRRKS
jgi:hypothetical protein